MRSETVLQQPAGEWSKQQIAVHRSCLTLTCCRNFAPQNCKLVRFTLCPLNRFPSLNLFPVPHRSMSAASCRWPRRKRPRVSCARRWRGCISKARRISGCAIGENSSGCSESRIFSVLSPTRRSATSWTRIRRWWGRESTRRKPPGRPCSTGRPRLLWSMREEFSSGLFRRTFCWRFCCMSTRKIWRASAASCAILQWRARRARKR